MKPTFEEFELKFSPHMLLFLAQAWSVRNASDDIRALTIDTEHQRGRKLLRAIYRYLTEEPNDNETAREPAAPRPNTPGPKYT